MKWRPVLIIVGIFFILCLLVVSYLLGFNGGVSDALAHPAKYDEKKKKDIVIATPVKFLKTRTVKNQAYQVNVSGLGRVHSSQAITISAEVQGVLRKGTVRLKKGTSFKKGQVLFSVNNGDAALMLKARKSSYLNLLATTLPDIKLDYSEHYEVWKMFFDAIDLDRNLPPMPPLVDAKLKTLLASRNILGEYYTIKADQVRLSKYTIYAPFNGTITDAFADQGSIVNPGVAVINIINDGQLEVECPIRSDQIDLVKIGSSVALSDENGNHWNGQVSRKGQYINPNTQSIPVFIEVKGRDDRLYNGMYLDAQMKGDSVYNVFEVPRRALLEEGDVLFALQDSSLIRKKVDVRVLLDETVLIGGLEDQLNVVAEPVIDPGAAVKFAVQK